MALPNADDLFPDAPAGLPAAEDLFPDDHSAPKMSAGERVVRDTLQEGIPTAKEEALQAPDLDPTSIPSDLVTGGAGFLPKVGAVAADLVAQGVMSTDKIPGALKLPAALLAAIAAGKVVQGAGGRLAGAVRPVAEPAASVADEIVGAADSPGATSLDDILASTSEVPSQAHRTIVRATPPAGWGPEPTQPTFVPTPSRGASLIDDWAPAANPRNAAELRPAKYHQTSRFGGADTGRSRAADILLSRRSGARPALPRILEPASAPEVPLPPPAPPAGGGGGGAAFPSSGGWTPLERKLGLDYTRPTIDPEVLAAAKAEAAGVVPSEGWAQRLTSPLSRAERAADPVEQYAGEQLRAASEVQRRVEHYLQKRGVDLWGSIPTEQRGAVRLAIRGGTVDQLPPDLAPRAQAIKQEYADIYEMLRNRGVMQRAGSQQIPVQMKENFVPARYDIKDPRVLRLAEEADISPNEALRQLAKQAKDEALGRIAMQPSSTPFLQQSSKLTSAQQAALEEAGRLPEEVDPLLAHSRYIKDISRQYALAHASGSGELERGVGKGFVDVLAGVRDPVSKAALENQIRHLYKTRWTDMDKAVGGITKATSRMLLPYAWELQPTQMASPIAHFGLGNVVRGRRAYGADDAIRELADISGAADSGYSGMLSSELGLNAASKPMQWMTDVESRMRGKYAATAAYFKANELGAAAAAGQRTPAMAKEAAELGTNLDELADAVTRGGGRIDPQTHRSLAINIMQRGSDRTLLQTQGGHLPGILDTDVGRTLLAYKKFGVGQSQMVMDDYIRPLLSGDPSLMGLGAKRLAKHTGASLVFNAPISAVRAAQVGQVPSLARYAGDTIGSSFGTIGDVGYNAQDYFRNPDSRRDPLTSIVGIPALSIGTQTEESLRHAGQNVAHGEIEPALLQTLSTAIRLGAMADPVGYYAMGARPLAAGIEDYRKSIDKPNRQASKNPYAGFR